MPEPAPEHTAHAGEIADDLFRRESARLVAMLVGQFGTHRLQLAEDVVQESLVRALQLATHPATRQARTHALLALMLLNAARLPARTDDAGHLLRLHEQDRTAWNRGMIARGLHYLALASTGDHLREYHLQAGIAAGHCVAADEALTDWPRILEFYDHLAQLNSSPVIALNRAVAVARVHGAQAGRDALQATRVSLEHYYLYHAVQGRFALELGFVSEALAHFRKAESLAMLASEQEFLGRCIQDCVARLAAPTGACNPSSLQGSR